MDAKKYNKPVKPQFKFRGAEAFQHDLYKLQIATMLRNQSYIADEPRLERTEHTHFFHSKDRRGRPLTRSCITGDHFHEVGTSIDDKGDPTATCGPAKHVVDVQVQRGRSKTWQKQTVVPSWYDKHKDEDVTDSHTHEIKYLHSEFISAKRIAAQQVADKEAIAKLMHNAQQETGNDQSTSNRDMG